MSGPTQAEEAELIEVHLISIPVAIWARAQEHGDELVREFTLIAEQMRHEGSTGELPVRLIELVTALTSRYANLSAEQEARLADAAKRGVPEIKELTFRMPAHAGAAAATLGDMLAEVDEYCRAGDHLLTLATPADVVQFRNWYLSQFERQLAGEAPTPWTDYIS